MNHLHLVIPDLLPPRAAARDVLAGLLLPYLEKLLARSEHVVLPAASAEDCLGCALGVTGLAPLRAQGDGLDTREGYWLCADPVELQMQPSQVILQPEVDCTEAEARALCAALNAHFADDGLRFFAPRPQHWYVQAASLGEVAMTPTRAAAWQDVKSLLPQGADARRWLRWGNEMQMLLHQHPLNAARQENGKPAINSLWLWGGGKAGTPLSSLAAAGSRAPLLASCAKGCGLALHTELPGLLAGPHAGGLWLEQGLREAWQRADIYAYRMELERIERDVAATVWRAMLAGNLHALTVEAPTVGALHRFSLTRAGCWKLWRRSAPLWVYLE